MYDDLRFRNRTVCSNIGCGRRRSLRQHFLDMGLIPGIEVTLIKFAPMGDPMELMVSGYSLTLRLADAARIDITNVHEHPGGRGEVLEPIQPARTFLTRESVKRAEEENETEMYRKIISFSHWREIRIAAKPPCSTN